MVYNMKFWSLITPLIFAGHVPENKLHSCFLQDKQLPGMHQTAKGVRECIY